MFKSSQVLVFYVVPKESVMLNELALSGDLLIDSVLCLCQKTKVAQGEETLDLNGPSNL